MIFDFNSRKIAFSWKKRRKMRNEVERKKEGTLFPLLKSTKDFLESRDEDFLIF